MVPWEIQTIAKMLWETDYPDLPDMYVSSIGTMEYRIQWKIEGDLKAILIVN